MHCVLDTEVYANYFLATFMREDGKVVRFERFNDRDEGDLGAIGRQLLTEGVTLVTFNGNRYDIPILSLAMMGARNGVIKEASDLIINRNWWPWDLERKYKFTRLQVDHIDIIELLPLFESLKLYAARVNAENLQDLPFDPAEMIDPGKIVELREYCLKDCNNTWHLFTDRWDQIQLRIGLGEKYGLDLRSKSDAQIAEAVIKAEYERITGSKLIKPIDAGNLPTKVHYDHPAFLEFRDPKLKSLLWAIGQWSFDLSEAGKPEAPGWLKRQKVTIDGREYTVGLGGLHANNKSESYWSDDDHHIIDLDVTSYYPAIILNCGYYPPHMGSTFTRIFEQLVNQRVEAKRAGDKVTADVLKITVNGTFGKLGSKYSAIYAPQLLLAVTFTGQLSLLMLIEKMALRGIQCVSANTDGITLKVASEQLSEMNHILFQWQLVTGFVMEETRYKSIHYRDVNNYFAETVDGQIKTKGIFKDPDVSKNPTAPVVAWAVIECVLSGTPVKDVIEQVILDGDVTAFLSVRTVKGGAVKDGEYLGKAVRWYYSTDTDTAIHYISNGNKVAKTDGAMPMMDLTDKIPEDLDKWWYINEALDIISQVGVEPWQ